MACSLYGKQKEDGQKVIAAARINEILAEIHGLYAEAAELATEHELTFSYNGPAGYGDGGYFDPDDVKDEWGNEIYGWTASSRTC